MALYQENPYIARKMIPRQSYQGRAHDNDHHNHDSDNNLNHNAGGHSCTPAIVGPSLLTNGGRGGVHGSFTGLLFQLFPDSQHVMTPAVSCCPQTYPQFRDRNRIIPLLLAFFVFRKLIQKKFPSDSEDFAGLFLPYLPKEVVPINSPEV